MRPCRPRTVARMLSERVERLEERLAWLERHVTQQDKAMLELHEELSKLHREMGVLRLRLESASGTTDASATSPADERPPHY